MNDEDRELARLRRRAYGPAGDIENDSRALARLRELESRRSAADGHTLNAERVSAVSSSERGAATTAEEASVPTGPDPTARDLISGATPSPDPYGSASSPTVRPDQHDSTSSPTPRPDQHDSTSGTASRPHERRPSTTDTGSPSRRMWRGLRTPPWWWWLITAGAVVLAIAVTVALQPRPAAVLYPQPGGPDPSSRNTADVLGMFGDEFTYAAFHGVDIWAQSDNQRCLVVEAPAGDGSSSIPACRRGSFPTSVDLTVGFGVTVDAAGGLPRGTGVRFVNLGDRIEVWIQPADEGLPGVSRQ